MSRSYRSSILRRVAVTVIACAVPAAAVSPAAAEPESAAECVRFELTESDPSLVYSVDNSCPRAVRCTVAWRLVCGDPSPDPARSDAPRVATYARRTALRVAAGQIGKVTVTTAPCDAESWRVEDLEWICSE